MIGVDANVLVYFYDEDRPTERATARDLLRRGAVQGLFIPGQCLSEFIRASTRKLGFDRNRAVAAVDLFQRTYAVSFATLQDFTEAVAMFRDHLIPIFDALMMMTAKNAGCTHLLSQDGQDGHAVGGMTIVNPFNPGNKSLIDRLLPPVG